MNALPDFTGTSVEELEQHVAALRLVMKSFRKVVANSREACLFDVNRTQARFPGLSLGHPLLPALLRAAGASFDPETVHQVPMPPAQGREWSCSVRYPWGHDRVL